MTVDRVGQFTNARRFPGESTGPLALSLVNSGDPCEETQYLAADHECI